MAGHPGRALRGLASGALAIALFANAPARADESTRIERAIAEGLAQDVEEEHRLEAETPWTIFPQIGYDPESQLNGGVKFRTTDLFDTGFFFDVNTVLSINRRQEATITLGDPHIGDTPYLSYVNVGGYMDDSKEFFGLGNNDVGPDPVSNENIRRIAGAAAFGMHLLDGQLAITGSLTPRWTKVGRGQSHKTPSTTTLFPDLPGIRGGWTSEMAVSAVFSTRRSVARPTQGWVLLFKTAYVPSLGSDFEYTRLLFDASYLYPLLTRRQVLGVRLGGEALLGPSDRIPFYELSYLGGEDTLRGYFPQRFLGKGRVLGSAEYRLKLVDFEFMDVWHVFIDGVGFVDAGRVFLDAKDFEDNFLDSYRWDYGGGVRIAFSSGEVARIDVAFSEENKPLVYLTFGHTF
ncbi:MAG TPA: BamA/TamA family outer membrane protein [Candidatus Binatia bacterium]|nr:BamA/TamA family outer membrane protein [Candidatus Binatia bacterium]